MTRYFIALSLALLLAAQAHAKDERGLAVTRTNSATGEQRVALVIGNGAYINSPLKNPVNDAKDMANKLRGLGFDVIERNNLQTRQIGGTLREFRSKLSPGAVALVFYAGHGLQIKGTNYLPAVDADINSEEDVPNQSIAVNQIMDVLDESKTRLNLVFLDACRNNPYARSFRSAERGLARVSAPSGTLISYATKPGSVAADGDGRNGLYTGKLLTQMDSNLQIEQTLKQVVTAVKAASQGKQEPWMEGSIEGDFCFAGCAASDGTQVASLVPVPAPTRIKSKEEIEQDTWDSVRDSNDVDAVNEYLKQYPKGRFAGQARVLIIALKKSPAKPAEPVASPSGREDAETMLWGEAQKGNSKEDYQAYLDQYPKGKYAALAKSRIKKLQDDAQAAAEQQEQQAWEAAQDENSEESYVRYLKGYPNGRYAGLAKARQEKLKNDLAAKEEAELWKKADSGNDKAAVEAYLNRYPSGRYLTAASAKLQAIREEAAKGPAMVRIPGKNYEMGKYHVTRGEFAKFVSETGYDAGNECYVWTGKWEKKTGYNWRNPGFSQDDTHPVACVNWNDAQAYASWLARKTGKQYRLPIESEWEYACAGGNTSEYCGSNDINAVAWYKENSNSTTHPVGQKQANGYGLYDMSGNLWQWMENKYDDKNDWRALRGGSWSSAPQYVRASARSNDVPANRGYINGFRLARTLP